MNEMDAPHAPDSDTAAAGANGDRPGSAAERSNQRAGADGWVVVARRDELPPGRLKRVAYGDAPVVLANVEGQLYAMSDTCQHHGASLAEGAIRGTSVICVWHAWRYDAASGRLVNPPSDRLHLTTYPIRLDGDAIAIGPPSSE